MKYLILLTVVFLVGCSDNQNGDTCLDGYLLSDFNNRVSAFCTHASSYREGISGDGCSNLPNSDPQKIGSIVLKEGTLVSTKCFNRKHGFSEAPVCQRPISSLITE